MRTEGPAGVRNSQRLIVGPWVHRSVDTLQPSPIQGDVDFGPDSVLDLRAIELQWLDHYIKGVDNGIDKEPPVKIFTMGENIWHDYADWPVPGTQYPKYYLQSKGAANTMQGDGLLVATAPASQEKADEFTYNPENPVPTVGGALCCAPEVLPWGATDQRAVERRDDVLVYVTPPLETEVRVTGHVVMQLWASTSAHDTDFTAKLVDVSPNGFAMNLTAGVVRARYRNSREHPDLVEPGKPFELTIDLFNTSNVFKRGHRILVEISSSNFPQFSRNTNTGKQPESDTDWESAHQQILHDSAHPSRITLPILNR